MGPDESFAVVERVKLKWRCGIGPQNSKSILRSIGERSVSLAEW